MPQRRPRASARRLADAYLDTREMVVQAGFAGELDWQDGVRWADLTETTFLREAAWVVLSAGLSELVVRRVFGPVSEAFFGWRSASAVTESASRCISRALPWFGHRRKLEGIAAIAREVHWLGFGQLRNEIEAFGVVRLQSLDFVGPVTCFHLAKNLGLDVVKPDRHLVRIAAAVGVVNAQDLCEQIAAVTGDRLATVDLVIWRSATLDPTYFVRRFARGGGGSGGPTCVQCRGGASMPPDFELGRADGCVGSRRSWSWTRSIARSSLG